METRRLLRCAGLGLLALVGLTPGAFAQTSATITLSDTNTEKGIKLLNSADTQVVTQAKKKGREGTYFYFDVDDTFASKGSKDTLYATVEYYDEGTGAVQLKYDAHNPANESPEDDDPTTDIMRDNQTGTSRPVVRFDSGTWVQYTFPLTQAYLGNRQDEGSDFFLTTDDGSTLTVSKVTITTELPIELKIPYAATPPKVDGVLDEDLWKAEDGLFTLCTAQQDVIQPTKWTGKEDYCGTWHIAWDGEFLYVGGDVTDDVPRCNGRDTASTLWQGDALELYLGWDQSRPGRTSYISGNDFQFIIALGPTPLWAIFASGGVIPDGDLEAAGIHAAQYVAVVDKKAPDSGYTVEVRIPWNAFPAPDGNPHKAPAPNQLFGLNVFSDDGDGSGPGTDPLECGQEKAFSFTSRPASYGNPSAWATVQMLAPAPPPSAVPLGDVDGNKTLNIADVLVALRVLVGQVVATDPQKTAMDVNKDGKQDIRDVIMLLQRVAGIITKFPGE